MERLGQVRPLHFNRHPHRLPAEPRHTDLRDRGRGKGQFLEFVEQILDGGSQVVHDGCPGHFRRKAAGFILQVRFQFDTELARKDIARTDINWANLIQSPPSDSHMLRSAWQRADSSAGGAGTASRLPGNTTTPSGSDKVRESAKAGRSWRSPKEIFPSAPAIDRESVSGRA